MTQYDYSTAQLLTEEDVPQDTFAAKNRPSARRSPLPEALTQAVSISSQQGGSVQGVLVPSDLGPKAAHALSARLRAYAKRELGVGLKTRFQPQDDGTMRLLFATTPLKPPKAAVETDTADAPVEGDWAADTPAEEGAPEPIETAEPATPETGDVEDAVTTPRRRRR